MSTRQLAGIWNVETPSLRGSWGLRGGKVTSPRSHRARLEPEFHFHQDQPYCLPDCLGTQSGLSLYLISCLARGLCVPTAGQAHPKTQWLCARVALVDKAPFLPNWMLWYPMTARPTSNRVGPGPKHQSIGRGAIASFGERASSGSGSQEEQPVFYSSSPWPMEKVALT